MLYEAWNEIARRHGNEMALADLAAGRRWTFAELAREGETRGTEEQVIFPGGHGAEFIFDVLRAWRNGRVVCPLESGQAAPTLDGLPGKCAHLKTSSGSAGAPRMIAFTAEQLAADAENIVATMGLRPGWPNLGVISLAHSYGFSNLVMPLLLHGIPLILAPSRLPEALRAATGQFESVTLPAVPALWRVWMDAGAIGNSIKLAISAGAMLPVALEAQILARHGLKVHNFYGASECGGICYDAGERLRGSDEEAGTALRGVDLSVNGQGRLVVSSKAVGETYWPTPDPSLGGGTFQTGDRAAMCEGQLFLRGRHGDLINIAGQKVAPEAIEQEILRLPGVRECVVFGAPDPGGVRSETIVACVAGNGLDAAILARLMTERLPSWQAPRHWWIVPGLADAARGKISRAQWRTRFLAGQKPE